MGGLTLDEQLMTLCQTVEKAEVITDELRTNTLHYLEQYLHLASPHVRTKTIETVEAKFGVELNKVLGVPKDPIVEPLLHPCLPTTGWLGDYLQYTERHEAPDIFHFWVGVSILHAAIRRNIFFEHGYYRLFPNCYVILVAPPGVCKKSTATNIGVEILQEVPDVNIIREKITPEALVSTLGTRMAIQTKGGTQITPSATAFIHAPELAVFLGRETYNEGLIALLTTLFDSHTKWEYTTKASGKSTLHNIHLTLLGATTPDLLSAVIPESAMGGGFLSRTIFAVKENTPRCEPFPRPRDPLLKEKLIAVLSEISLQDGQCVQSPEALAWCEDWYRKQRERVQEEIALSGYYERKQSHLIKLAMTLLVSDRAALIITPEVYERALKLLDFTEVHMSKAFNKVHKTAIGQDHESILDHLARNHGRLTHSALLRKVYNRMDARRFEAALSTLRQAGMVDEILTKTGKGREYVLRRKG